MLVIYGGRRARICSAGRVSTAAPAAGKKEFFIWNTNASGTLVLRLDPPEEICESITAAARAENIALAEISGIGAADSFTVGVYNTVTKEYRSNTLNGAYEIVSLTGTLTSKDGEPYLHLHFSAGDENGRVSGGYLNRAAVSATAEIITG